MSSYYSLAAKFASEVIGMCLTIFLGESILANELLPSTKGHAMGILAVALGFGLAFGVNIAWFGAISAHLNPAMFFFLAILGKLQDGWAEFAVGMAGDFVGAFCGAVLVYLHFSDHFWTVPLPQDEDKVTKLLHGFPDALDENASRFASALGPSSSRPVEGTTIRKEFQGFYKNVRGRQSEEDVIEKMEMRRKARKQRAPTEDTAMTRNRANSVQVADLLHQHDPKILDEQELTKKGSSDERYRHSVQVAGMLHTHDTRISTSGGDGGGGNPDMTNGKDASFSPSTTEIQETPESFRQEMYEAALAADAHAKLSIFATRPAKYNRWANFYQEMVATAVLVSGAEMFTLRLEYQEAVDGVVDGQLTKALFISLFIAVLILGLGGTTGLAVNPARDFGPQLAHALLPIPGKGDSEWHYAFVPFFAPFVGAELGALFYWGIEALYKTSDDVEL